MPNMSSGTQENSQINLARLERFVIDETRRSWAEPEAGHIGIVRQPYGISSDSIAPQLLAALYCMSIARAGV